MWTVQRAHGDLDIAEWAQALALEIRRHKGAIKTEEAIKSAFVMPFISLALGYDVFNPAEAIPEFTGGVSTKRGENIDYVIVHNVQVQVLVEAKKVNDPPGRAEVHRRNSLSRAVRVTWRPPRRDGRGSVWCGRSCAARSHRGAGHQDVLRCSVG